MCPVFRDPPVELSTEVVQPLPVLPIVQFDRILCRWDYRCNRAGCTQWLNQPNSFCYQHVPGAPKCAVSGCETYPGIDSVCFRHREMRPCKTCTKPVGIPGWSGYDRCSSCIEESRAPLYAAIRGGAIPCTRCDNIVEPNGHSIETRCTGCQWKRPLSSCGSSAELISSNKRLKFRQGRTLSKFW